MKIELKTIFGDLIIEGDFSSLAVAIQEARRQGKSLRSADLRYADLSYADLSSADLRYADLSYAKNAELVIAMTRILPEGSIIGWKKLRGGVVAKLRIPEQAKRSHAFGRKCRAECAEVLAMFDRDGKPLDGVGYSTHSPSFKYRVGETVRPIEPFSNDWASECASGIHFFITREEAENYLQ